MEKILFVSHKNQQCGVYQFGHNLAKALRNSKIFSFVYAECSGVKDFNSIVTEIRPAAIIYNYYPSTMPWLSKKVIRNINVPHIAIFHEVTQELADAADDFLFDYHIAPDPTLLLRNPIVFKTGRLVPRYASHHPLPDVPTIGSFGFGTHGKGFERLIRTVQSEFDVAEIRLHIPFATFGDADGSSARAIAKKCKEMIFKSNICLKISHEFLSQNELLDFLSKNSMNAFFYEQNDGRGISSVIDFALAAHRPIAISRSSMFRHLSSVNRSICIDNSSLKFILKNGLKPLLKFNREWCEANLIWDYERIVKKILSSKKKSSASKILGRLKRIFSRAASNRYIEYWIPAIKHSDNDHILSSNLDEKLEPTSIPHVSSYNRILNNDARELYKPVTNSLFDILPELMKRKIPEANIQQAFVLDTVIKYVSSISDAEILCIGSYDDTAAAALKKYGYEIDEVDPVLNYDLNTFFNKPTTTVSYYDIIFSTSVIEHVQDDERFITQIAKLLAPGGIAILTCDYNDQHKKGDPIPVEDFRMYTKNDFNERLLPLLKDCTLVDDPKWDCQNPDFTYAGCQYTFASLVFRKNAS